MCAFNFVEYLFVCCKDYDDLEFSIVSLDGRQWLFEAATLEVNCLLLCTAFVMFYKCGITMANVINSLLINV